MMNAATQPVARDQDAAIAVALERERRRLADELHDSAIQQIVLARILIERAAQHGPAEPLERAGRLLDEALQQLRCVVLGLTPALLEHQGLGPTIQWLGEQLGERWGLDYHCRVVGEAVALPDALTETLFQGARELMTNAGRHAHSSSCEVVLEFNHASVVLSVCDDGIGIDRNHRHRAIPGVEGGFGLISLRTRSAQLGGALALGPCEGGGTRAVLHLPLPKPAPRQRRARGHRASA